MTTDLVRVLSVTDQETQVPNLRLFIITAVKVARPDVCVQVETVNAYAASLCERAQVLGRPIAIEHERTKYGNTLRGAHFIKTAAA